MQAHAQIQIPQDGVRKTFKKLDERERGKREREGEREAGGGKGGRPRDRGSWLERA